MHYDRFPIQRGRMNWRAVVVFLAVMYTAEAIRCFTARTFEDCTVDVQNKTHEELMLAFTSPNSSKKCGELYKNDLQLQGPSFSKANRYFSDGACGRNQKFIKRKHNSQMVQIGECCTEDLCNRGGYCSGLFEQLFNEEQRLAITAGTVQEPTSTANETSLVETTSEAAKLSTATESSEPTTEMNLDSTVSNMAERFGTSLLFIGSFAIAFVCSL